MVKRLRLSYKSLAVNKFYIGIVLVFQQALIGCSLANLGLWFEIAWISGSVRIVVLSHCLSSVVSIPEFAYVKSEHEV